MRQIYHALWQPNLLARLKHSICKHQCISICQPNILAGKNNHPARNKQWILPSIHHPRKVVKCSINLARAHRFDKRRDCVIVLLALVIVSQTLRLHRLFDCLLRDFPINLQYRFNDGNDVARIAVCHLREHLQHVFVLNLRHPLDYRFQVLN